jgi:hypothetical protein
VAAKVVTVTTLLEDTQEREALDQEVAQVVVVMVMRTRKVMMEIHQGVESQQSQWESLDLQYVDLISISILLKK